MSEIVYTDVVKPTLGTGNGKQVAQRRYCVWQHRDKVSVSVGEYWTGIRHDQKNRWWRWVTSEAYGFRRSTTGQPIPFHCKRPELSIPKGWANITPAEPINMLDGDNELSEAFRNAMRETFKVGSFDDLFPMAERLGIGHFKGIPRGITNGLRANSMEEMTTRLFGKSRATKELVAAVAKSDPFYLALATQFRGYVDQKDLLWSLDREPDESLGKNLMNMGHYSVPSPYLRKTFSRMNRDEIKNILHWDIDGRELYDVMVISQCNLLNKNTKAVWDNIDKTRRLCRRFENWSKLRSAHSW